jgi:hypothetical protein
MTSPTTITWDELDGDSTYWFPVVNTHIVFNGVGATYSLDGAGEKIAKCCGSASVKVAFSNKLIGLNKHQINSIWPYDAAHIIYKIWVEPLDWEPVVVDTFTSLGYAFGYGTSVVNTDTPAAETGIPSKYATKSYYGTSGWYYIDPKTSQIWLNNDTPIPVSQFIKYVPDVIYSVNSSAIYIGFGVVNKLAKVMGISSETFTMLALDANPKYETTYASNFSCDLFIENPISNMGWFPVANGDIYWSHGWKSKLDKVQKWMGIDIKLSTDQKFAWIDSQMTLNHFTVFPEAIAFADEDKYEYSLYPSEIKPETPTTKIKAGAVEKGYRCIACGHKSDSLADNCNCCKNDHCTGCGQVKCYCCQDCSNYPCECDVPQPIQPCVCLKCQGFVKSKAKVAYVSPKSTKPGYGYSTVAPWKKRGIQINAATTSTAWKKVWDIDDQIDICTAASDFYLLSAIDVGINRYDMNDLINLHWWDAYSDLNNIRFELFELSQNARAIWEALAKRLAKSFEEYCHMAIGGELRHHKAVGNDALHRENRPAAWVGWKKVVEILGGEQAMRDAMELFGEGGWGGSFGGKRWAEAAEVMVYRLSGQLPDTVFVDRVFNLQHNNGVLLNKIEWKCNNTAGYNLNYLNTTILPAHGMTPQPDYKILLRCASPIIKTLFEKYWYKMDEYRIHEEHNSLCCSRKWSKGDESAWKVIYYPRCKYCGYNPHEGHRLTCIALGPETVSDPVQYLKDGGWYKESEMKPKHHPNTLILADHSLNVDAKVKVVFSCGYCSKPKQKTMTFRNMLTNEWTLKDACNDPYCVSAMGKYTSSLYVKLHEYQNNSIISEYYTNVSDGRVRLASAVLDGIKDGSYAHTVAKKIIANKKSPNKAMAQIKKLVKTGG